MYPVGFGSFRGATLTQYPQLSAEGEERPLQVLWEDGERVFCRTHRVEDNGVARGALAVHLMSEEPLLASVNRLVHEYELKDDLDSAWATRPLGLVRDRGQTVLLLEDPGGEPLSRLIGLPLEPGKISPTCALPCQLLLVGCTNVA